MKNSILNRDLSLESSISYKNLVSIKNVARTLRSIRNMRSLSQTDLAKAVGTSQSQIARMENPGYTAFSIHNLLKISNALNCNVNISIIPAENTTSSGILSFDVSSTSAVNHALRAQTAAVYTAAFSSRGSSEESIKHYAASLITTHESRRHYA